MSENSTDIPPRIPDFTLIRPIGEGGFGRVWLAENETTGRLRAVKLIPLRQGGRADRAGREIASITRLERDVAVDHPHLLAIDHVGRTDEYLFYVMDPADDVDGLRPADDPDYRPATLRNKLACGPFPPDECLADAKAMLAGLAALHAHGMVHRDVKPANCLYFDGKLKLADFGLLTAADPTVSRLGTEAYMPPDGRMDTRADVYAAGLVLYEMLTGHPPESFPQLGEQANRIAADPTLRALNRVALRACSRNAEKRFADAQEMAAAVDAFCSEGGSGENGQRVSYFRRSVLGGAALVTVALVAFLASYLSTPSSDSMEAIKTSANMETVAVRFTTQPGDALVLLDGEVLTGPNGEPLTTPCTAESIPAGRHHVVFRRFGLPDRDVGEVDFAADRGVDGSWE